MSDKKIEKWQRCKTEREQAEEWEALPRGPRYQNDKFEISIAHCKAPQLTRAGQQTSGGKNYWETGEKFNLAILEYIVDNWESISIDVLERLRQKEIAALRDCQQYVDEMQKLIDGAK
jgi:hypothetical protein